MIHVVHVIDSLITGGKERQLIELLKGATSAPDIRSSMVLMSDIVEYCTNGLDVPITIMPRLTRYDPSLFARLNRSFRASPPDIVHSWNAMCSLYAAPMAKLGGARFINGFVRSAMSGLSLRDKDYLLGKLTYPFSDAVVSNTHAGLRAFNSPPAKSICIHNGIDLARFAGLAGPAEARRALGITTPHVVGMVASFTQYKDFQAFFALADLVLSRRDDVTFVAVGEGPLMAPFQARYLGHPRVRLLGRRADAEQVVNAFTLGVLLSIRSNEGISNAIMEYMALGKPPIASRSDGNAELLGSEGEGYLVDNADTAGIARIVEQLLDDVPLRARLGAAAQARIANEFSLEKMTGAWLALYRRLAARR